MTRCHCELREAEMPPKLNRNATWRRPSHPSTRTPRETQPHNETLPAGHGIRDSLDQFDIRTGLELTLFCEFVDNVAQQKWKRNHPVVCCCPIQQAYCK